MLERFILLVNYMTPKYLNWFNCELKEKNTNGNFYKIDLTISLVISLDVRIPLNDIFPGISKPSL